MGSAGSSSRPAPPGRARSAPASPAGAGVQGVPVMERLAGGTSQRPRRGARTRGLPSARSPSPQGPVLRANTAPPRRLPPPASRRPAAPSALLGTPPASSAPQPDSPRPPPCPPRLIRSPAPPTHGGHEEEQQQHDRAGGHGSLRMNQSTLRPRPRPRVPAAPTCPPARPRPEAVGWWL